MRYLTDFGPTIFWHKYSKLWTDFSLYLINIITFFKLFINVFKVFFYIENIMKKTDKIFISYTVLLFVLNVLITFGCVKLIARIGRKRLLLVSLILTALNLILLTVSMQLEVYKCLSKLTMFNILKPKSFYRNIIFLK